LDYDGVMQLEQSKCPEFENESREHAKIRLSPGLMRERDWETPDLNPQFGKYAITTSQDGSRLVLLPPDGGEMKHLNSCTGTIHITRVTKGKESPWFYMKFKDGVLVEGPRQERDTEEI
jgi:hypothetical protein